MRSGRAAVRIGDPARPERASLVQPDLPGLERSENFPVALWALPATYRRDLRAVYAFARGVDQVGDAAAGDRLEALHRIAADVDRIWSGGRIADPVLVELSRVVQRHDLPATPFRRLVEANIQDQVVSRYPTYDDLLGYCRLSADPVGRIVLGIFGAATPANHELSDRVCTALQLLEHWQDVAEDFAAGRVYLPQEDLAAHGVDEAELTAPSASPELAGLMRFEIERAAGLLDRGRGLVGDLRGWARLSVAGFVAGGDATVAALWRTDGDVLGRRTAPSRVGTAARLVAALAHAMGGRRR